MLAIGQPFNKIWRIRNDGTCVWDANYLFVFIVGEPMTTTLAVPVPPTAPGATADILIPMTAPNASGTHAGHWQMWSPRGLFGDLFEVRINLVDFTPPLPPGCAGAPIIASFDADPVSIAAGQSSTLRWGKVDHATDAVIDQGIGGIGTPGSLSVNPMQTTTYTLTATGCGGIVTAQVTVIVIPESIAPPPPGCPGPPSIAFLEASPSTITAGQSSTLRWGAVTNATSAVIDPDVGGVATPGSTSVSPGTTRTYTLTATGCGGTVRRQVTITVKPGLVPLPGITIVIPLRDTVPPSISGATASPNMIVGGPGCSSSAHTTRISAVVTDAGGVNRVVARWSGVESGERAMGISGGNSYQAQLGPFSKTGNLSVVIVAWDKAGNSAQAGPLVVRLLPCLY